MSVFVFHYSTNSFLVLLLFISHLTILLQIMPYATALCKCNPVYVTYIIIIIKIIIIRYYIYISSASFLVCCFVWFCWLISCYLKLTRNNIRHTAGSLPILYIASSLSLFPSCYYVMIMMSCFAQIFASYVRYCVDYIYMYFVFFSRKVSSICILVYILTQPKHTH